MVPPAQLRGKAMAVVGAPGAGKTVTLLRLAYLAGVLGRKVCFVDCKGTDPTLVAGPDRRLPARRPGARVGCWPDTAMDMWRGSPAQVQSRLLAVEQFTEPFYQRVASAGLRLALTAPDMPPVEGSDELLRRLDVDELAALWEGRPLQLKDIEAIGDHLPGARLRYADFFAALAGAFDRGSWSYEDVDLAVLTVPTLLSKAEADAAMRVVLEDYGHYATGRKPREGEDALLVLDEFSALASGVDSAINLAERVRDVGVQVVVAAQSVEGLGDHRQAPRLLASCAGGIVVHQCADPERLLALAGMVRTLEHNWELDHYGPRGLAKARMGDRPRIDPEQVRQAQPGEAWVIQAGQSIHLRVLPPPAVTPEPVELTAALPLADDTMPLPAVEEPAPVGIAAAVALAGRVVRRVGQRMDQRRERAGRLPSPSSAAVAGRAATAWSGAAMRPPAGTGLACGAARGNPAPARGPAGCLLDGLPPGRRPPQGRCGTRSAPFLASLRDGLRPPLTRSSSRWPGETRSPGAGEEQRPTSRHQARRSGHEVRVPHRLPPAMPRPLVHLQLPPPAAGGGMDPAVGDDQRPHGRRGSRGPGAGPPGGDAPRLPVGPVRRPRRRRLTEAGT